MITIGIGFQVFKFCFWRNPRGLYFWTSLFDASLAFVRVYCCSILNTWKDLAPMRVYFCYKYFQFSKFTYEKKWYWHINTHTHKKAIFLMKLLDMASTVQPINPCFILPSNSWQACWGVYGLGVKIQNKREKLTRALSIRCLSVEHFS